jgi:hypothetical protein
MARRVPNLLLRCAFCYHVATMYASATEQAKPGIYECPACKGPMTEMTLVGRV